MLVLFQNPQLVLNRHLIAGERHNLRAELDVEVVKRCSLQGFIGGIGAHAKFPRTDGPAERVPRHPLRAPSVSEPERVNPASRATVRKPDLNPFGGPGDGLPRPLSRAPSTCGPFA